MSDRMRGPPKRSLLCQQRPGQPGPDSQPPSESECDADLRNMHKIVFFINRMVGVALAPETFKVGSKGWDWSVGSIQDP